MSEALVTGTLVHLFDAAVRFTSESLDDAVVTPDEREGEYLGSGDGVATGERVRGRLRWSFYAGNCLYPQIRRGEAVPDDLHLCTLNPGGYIESDDGARIAFDGRGYGLRSPDRYRLSMTMAFRTDDARYAWLNRVLGVMTGDFHEKTNRAEWHVYVPGQ
ncbi:MAG TPA: DUF3237 family protein [Vicinamibacterales bacterium]